MGASSRNVGDGPGAAGVLQLTEGVTGDLTAGRARTVSFAPFQSHEGHAFRVGNS